MFRVVNVEQAAQVHARVKVRGLKNKHLIVGLFGLVELVVVDAALFIVVLGQLPSPASRAEQRKERKKKL
jgi:hypothetical protein